MTDPQPTTHREPARVKPLYLVLGGVAVVAVAVGAILLFTGKGKSGASGTNTDGNITPTTGVFTFHVQPPQVFLTSPNGNPDKASKAAKPAASQVEKLIHDFYVQAYLAPGEWTAGTYQDVFGAFTEGAKAQAMNQLDVMTAGTSAADTFNSIKEKDATLQEKVLMDQQGQPYSVVAVVTFAADADKKDGTTSTLNSQGQYIFVKSGSSWQVASFSVNRDDKGKAPGGSVSPTAVPS